MSQTSLGIQIQTLAEKAKTGDSKAISELANIAFQFFNEDGVPQNTVFWLGLLKDLSGSGNETSRRAFADKISGFAIEISEEKPDIGFELFILASELGNLQAKRNLAVCFFNGEGTKKQLNKVVGLLKECSDGGDQFVLEDINTMAAQFLPGSDSGITPDLQKAVELFMIAAQAGHALALENLVLLGGWFYSGVVPCPQDIPQSIAILKMTAKLGDEKALANLGMVGAEMIQTEPNIGFELLSLASELGNFEAKCNLAEVKHLLTSILHTFNSHLPFASMPEIICEYLPEIQPVFFQYKNAPEAVNKNSSSASFVKLHL